MLCLEGFVNQRQFGFITLGLQGLDALAADFLVFGEQLEPGQRGFQLAAHHVVIDDILGVVGHGYFIACDRVEALAVLDHNHLVSRDFDGIIQHRLQIGSGLLVGAGQSLVERGHPVFGFPDCNAFYIASPQGISVYRYEKRSD